MTRSPHLSYREFRYLKQTLENYRFFRNSGNDSMAGAEVSSCLRHYDALPTKINMPLTPYFSL